MAPAKRHVQSSPPLRKIDESKYPHQFMSAKEMNRALSRIAKEIVEDRGLLQDYEGVRSRPFPIQNVAFYTVQSLYL